MIFFHITEGQGITGDSKNDSCELTKKCKNVGGTCVKKGKCEGKKNRRAKCGKKCECCIQN